MPRRHKGTKAVCHADEGGIYPHGVMPRSRKGTKQHEVVPDVTAEQVKAPRNATNSRRHETTQGSSRCPQNHDSNISAAYGFAPSGQDIGNIVAHDDTVPRRGTTLITFCLCEANGFIGSFSDRHDAPWGKT